MTIPILVSASFVPVSANAMGKKTALLVGVSKFLPPNDNLPWVIPTQSRMAKWLKEDQGFFVGQPILDTGASSKSVLNEIDRQTAGLGIGDSFVFVLHTHGYLGADGQSGYLMQAASPPDYLTAKQLGKAIKPAVARGVAVTLIMETCHSGGTLSYPNVAAQGVFPNITFNPTGISSGNVIDKTSEIRQEVQEKPETPLPEIPVTTNRTPNELKGTLTILSACTADELSWMSDLCNGAHFSVTLCDIVGKDKTTPWSELMAKVRTKVKSEYDALIRTASKNPKITQTPIIRGANVTPFQTLKAFPPITVGQFSDDYSTIKAEDSNTFDLWAEKSVAGNPSGTRLTGEDSVRVSTRDANSTGDEFYLYAKAKVPGWLFVLDRDGKEIVVQTANFKEPGPKTDDEWLAQSRIDANDKISFGRKAVDQVGTQQIIGIFIRDEDTAKAFVQNLSTRMVESMKVFSKDKQIASTRSLYTSIVQFKVVASSQSYPCKENDEEGIDFGDFRRSSSANVASAALDNLNGSLLSAIVKSVQVGEQEINIPGADSDYENLTTRLFPGFSNKTTPNLLNATKSDFLSALASYKRTAQEVGVIYLSAPGTVTPDGQPAIVFSNSKFNDANSLLTLRELESAINAKSDPKIILILDSSFCPAGQELEKGQNELTSKFVKMFSSDLKVSSELFSTNANFEYLCGSTPTIASGSTASGSILLEVLIELGKPFLREVFDWVLGRLGVKSKDRQRIVGVVQDIVVGIMDKGGKFDKDTIKQIYPPLLQAIIENNKGVVSKFMDFWNFIGNPVTNPNVVLNVKSQTGYYRPDGEEELSMSLKDSGYVFLLNVDMKGQITLLRPQGKAGDPAELSLERDAIISRAYISQPVRNGPTRINTIGFQEQGIESMVAVSTNDKDTATLFVDLLKKSKTLSVAKAFEEVQKWMVSNLFKGKSNSKVSVAVRNFVVVK